MFPFLLQLMGAGQRLFPVGAQRFDDRRDDQPFDVGARRVMRAEFGAFSLVQRTLQQRAEDGGLDIAPVALGGDPELMDIVLFKRDRLSVSKQRAVEVLDRRVQVWGVTALVHDLPQALERRGEMLGRLDHPSQQLFEHRLRQQADILGEHRKQTAHEEFSNLPRIMLPL